MKEKSSFNMGTELPQDMIDDYTAKRYETCKEKCLKLLETEENNCYALLYLGIISESEERYDDAVTYFKRITTIEPRFPFSWDFLGEVYMRKEEYEHAYNAFTELVALMQAFAWPWCKCAVAADKMSTNNTLALGILDFALTKVKADELSSIAYCKGRLEESAGNIDDALMSYIQSQRSAIKDEDKITPTERIYKMLKSEE